jgi:hypothetical protein
LHGLAASGEKGIVELVMATHAGMTTEDFGLQLPSSPWKQNAHDAPVPALPD